MNIINNRIKNIEGKGILFHTKSKTSIVYNNTV